MFAILDTTEYSVDDFLAKLNYIFSIIKFAVELEKQTCLRILNTLVFRNTTNKLEFDVYRKETSTSRQIPLYSPRYCIRHKMAN